MIRLALLAAAFSLASAAQASSYVSGPIAVEQPWSRPAAAGMTAAGFLTLQNNGAGTETLVAIQSPAAARVEVHRSAMDGGVMRMGKVDRVPVPGGGSVTFAPGGYHLMLVGLKAPLKAGQKFPATLRFASGRAVTAAFTVSSGMGPPTDGHHH